MDDAKVNELDGLKQRLQALKKAVEAAEGREISDSDFSKRYLPFSLTTLIRIKSGNYEGSAENMAEKVAQAEEEIAERTSSIRISFESERMFVATTIARATQVAIKKARDSKNRRVVVVLAPTGAGKSEIGKMLAARGAAYIEGRQSWKNSYKAFCADLARLAGRPMRVKKYSEHDAEERMLAALRSRDNTLYIDEANTLSRECVNAIKLIVNTTGSVVVIAAVPGTWDKLTEGAEDEVSQLVNRCQPILRYKGMAEADVRPFLTHAGLSDADIAGCAGMIVEAANEFGAFNTITTLIDEIKLISHPTVDDVTAFVKFHRKNTDRSGIKKGMK